MPTSPNLAAQGPLSVTILSDGRRVPDTVSIVSVHVRRAFGALPTARIVVLDGDMPSGAWPVSEGPTFRPGAAITVSAGYGTGETVLFKGIVVQAGLRIEAGGASTLVADCVHPAVAMTVARRSAVFHAQSDREVIESLLSRAGLAARVDPTDGTHDTLVQHDATDWDFMLARAEANGALVLATDDGVQVRRPSDAGAAVLSVAWGTDLLEFRAELDARGQLRSVETAAWDPARQAVVEGAPAAPAALASQGDLDGMRLAAALGSPSVRLQACIAATQGELSAWGRARQLKAALARIRGRMKFQGSALARPDALIEVNGVGAHYAGNVFVTAVEHDIADGDWVTTAEFGQSDEWFCTRPGVSAPAASALLPAAGGLHVGVVKGLDDPAGALRIQVLLPVCGEGAVVWARLAQWHASKGSGAFFVPEVGDEVVVGFFNQDPNHAVVLGSLYSASRPAAERPTAENTIKSFTTRRGHRLEFDESAGSVSLSTPAGNKVVLNDKDDSITLQDRRGNGVTLEARGVRIDTLGSATITAKGDITLEATGALRCSAAGDVRVQGLNVSCEGQAGFAAKGAATAELSAAGETVVKGAMVRIN
ncbi:MAG: type VI secretion system tip protein VgrG [Rubrivivax sp.]|nr:type VI secretion system tip protein VgrG [Rubrivivax sp.]